MIFVHVRQIEHLAGDLNRDLGVLFPAFQLRQARHAVEVRQVVIGVLFSIEADGFAGVGNAVADDLGAVAAEAFFHAGAAAEIIRHIIFFVLLDDLRSQVDGLLIVALLVVAFGFLFDFFVSRVRVGFGHLGKERLPQEQTERQAEAHHGVSSHHESSLENGSPVFEIRQPSIAAGCGSGECV